MYWQQKIYRINLSLEDYLAKLEKLIEKKEDNSISNHFLLEQRHHGNIVRGIIKTDAFTLWRTNGDWGGYFYPIFKGEQLAINDTPLLKLSVRPNPAAEILLCITIVPLLLLIIFGFVLVGEASWTNLLGRAFWGLILFLILQSPALIIHYTLKNQTLEALKKYLALTEVKLKRKK